MRFFTFLFVVASLLLVQAARAQAPTKLVVRAKAKDAKFIGSSIGGALVVVRNVQTGEILAKGQTWGSTGNTRQVMQTPVERGNRLSDENTARFEANIFIKEPTRVRIEVTAPVNALQAAVDASTELWMIPGKHIEGDGVIVEIPGFIVDILLPQRHEFISLSSLAEPTLELRANMVMMCGCTISLGGLWDANKIEVTALVRLNGKTIEEVPLQIKQQVNTFEGRFTLTQPGNYEIIVYGYDAQTGNTGVDMVNLVVGE